MGKTFDRWPYQEDFLGWLADNREHLAFPVEDLTVTRGSVAFFLGGINRLLRVQIYANAVCVEVQHRGLKLSELIRFSMMPADDERTGWLYCTHCLEHGDDRLYPDRAIMAQEHLYLPLMRWLKEDMPEQDWIEIVQFVSGGVTAKQWPYSYSTPSLHFQDFMSQLEMKFEMALLYPCDYHQFAGFYFAPLVGESPRLQDFIDFDWLREFRRIHGMPRYDVIDY